MAENSSPKISLKRLGQLFLFGIALLWLLKIPIKIGDFELEYEPLILAMSVGGAFLLELLPRLTPRKDRPISSETRLENRQRMLDKVELIWIKSYLDHVLNEMNSLKLEVKFVEPAKVLQRIGMTDDELPDSTALLGAFNELGRRLVILGEPGAGKTVTLLQIANELIKEARKDMRKPIPVVLALSSWAAEQLPFEDWLRQEIREKYGLSSKIADDLVQGEQLLYLLDGLDEVAEGQRNACVKAIKQFVEARPVNYVICCRRKEFVDLSIRLDIPCEVILQPLTDEQIGEYLVRDGLEGLIEVWVKSETLRNLGRVPFMLNTIAVVMRGKNERQIRLEIKNFDDPALLRDGILEAYVNRRLQQMPNERYPSLRRTREQIKWLAEQLVKHDQTDFYIERLQPTALDKGRKLYKWIVRIIIGLLLGIAYGGQASFLLVVGVGIIFAILPKRSDVLDSIQITDHLIWKISRKNIRSGIEVGLSFSLLAGFSVGITTNPINGLIVFVIFTSVTAVTSGFSSEERIEMRIEPNIGINRSISNFLLVLFICMGSFVSAVFISGLLASSSILEISVVMRFVLALAMMLSIVTSLIHGGRTVISHIVLRLFLARSGHIPYWRYDRFLDYCAELVILRKVGGGYRFVHDYMRQYLASAAFVPDPAVTPSQD